MSSSMKDSVDGLPKQFISSLRILFDILDERRSGLVRLEDIESRWSDDGVRGLPPGVVEGLRKVTPPNGLLSFDRFVAGLKLVLTKRRDEPAEVRRPFMAKENRTPLQEYNALDRGHLQDGSSNKFMNDIRHASRYPSNITTRDYDGVQQNPSQASQRPHQYHPHAYHPKPADPRHHGDSHVNGPSTFQSHRKSSPVQTLKSGSVTQRDPPYSAYAIKPEVSNYPNAVGSHHGPPNTAGNFRRVTSNTQLPAPQDRERPPAVPPRTDRPPRMNYSSSQMKKSMSGPNLHSDSPPAVPPRDVQQNARILNDLKNWQREWTATQAGDKHYGGHDQSSPSHRNPSQDHAIYANIEQFQRRPDDQEQQKQQHSQQAGPQKATVRRHGSGRRHTLANGIDQNMLKRMKQLEEETTMLRSGLAMVDSAKEWYMKQLAAVADKQTMLGKVNYSDNSVEAYQERMNFQRARIAEINQHLRTLLESSEKGFPLHMNLAMSTAAPKPAGGAGDGAAKGLKEHNSHLRNEIEQKKDRISQLEKEKASLVRELFEARSKNKSNYDDTTFM